MSPELGEEGADLGSGFILPRGGRGSCAGEGWDVVVEKLWEMEKVWQKSCKIYSFPWPSENLESPGLDFRLNYSNTCPPKFILHPLILLL